MEIVLYKEYIVTFNDNHISETWCIIIWSLQSNFIKPNSTLSNSIFNLMQLILCQLVTDYYYLCYKCYYYYVNIIITPLLFINHIRIFLKNMSSKDKNSILPRLYIIEFNEKLINNC